MRTARMMMMLMMMKFRAIDGWQNLHKHSWDRSWIFSFCLACLFNPNFIYKTRNVWLAQGPVILMPKLLPGLSQVRQAENTIVASMRCPTYLHIITYRLGNSDSCKKHNRKMYSTSCSWSALYCLWNYTLRLNEK